MVIKAVSKLPDLIQPLSDNDLFLVSQKQIDGSYESKKITTKKLINYAEHHVGVGLGMYSTIEAAIAAINGGEPTTQSQRAVIIIHAGEYEISTAIVVPPWTVVRGISKGAVNIFSDVSDVFICGHDVYFEDFTVTVGNSASTYAFVGGNSDAIHIRNVDFLNFHGYKQQKFLKQVGATWKILFIEHCVIDYRASDDYAILIESTSGVRWVDTTINDCFIDAYALSNFGGSVLARNVQDFRIWNSVIRGENPHNTGVRLEGGAVEVRGTFFNGFLNTSGGVSIYGSTGTNVYISNSDAPSSIFDGSVVNRNSNVS